MQLCQKEKCTSCGACTVSCPQNAIYFETNEYGFCYPRIDDAKCVDCGLCRKSCHVLNELNGNIPQRHMLSGVATLKIEKQAHQAVRHRSFIMRF